MLKRFLQIAALCSSVALGQNPNSPVYPSGVAADSDLFVATNRASTTLNGGISNSDTSIVLTSGALFTAPVIVTVEAEIVHCTTLTTNTLSGCVRGRQGTSAVSHSSGAVVTGFSTAWHHNQLAAEIKALETYAPRTAWTSNVTGQSTAQNVTLATAPGAGSYRLQFYASQNAACTTGNSPLSFTFGWTDSGAARTLTTGNLFLSTAQSTASWIAGLLPIYVASGNVTYTSTIGTCASGTATYDVHVSLEKIQ